AAVRGLTASGAALIGCDRSPSGSGREKKKKENPMSDDEKVSRSESHRLSRRALMRLGLLAIPATQVPLGFPHPAAAQGTKLGADLIGKLEGAVVVTDPALYPKSFKEAPQLAELVKAGKLPPVQERIGQDPLVIKPLREIGKYGGTWRRGF